MDVGFLKLRTLEARKPGSVGRKTDGIQGRAAAITTRRAGRLHEHRDATHHAVVVRLDVHGSQNHIGIGLARTGGICASEHAQRDLIDACGVGAWRRLLVLAVKWQDVVRPVRKDDRNPAFRERVGEGLVAVSLARVRKRDVEGHDTSAGVFQVLQHRRVASPRDGESADCLHALVVQAHDDHVVVRACLADEPIFRMTGQVDQTGAWLGVASELLRVHPESQSAEYQSNQNRDDGAIGVPVADVAAQARSDHSARVAGLWHDPNVTVKVGIAGWIDKSLIDSGLFYPMNAKSSEERLNFYASQFSLVEVDSTYYGMPKKENSDLWVARTPAGFTFDVKSFSLFTNHPTKPMALPKDIRDQLPEKLREKNIYIEQMPPELVDESWERFREALEPLRAAGKLGAVFFQFPPWFLPSSRSLSYVEQCQERMFGFQIAVEFRKPEWLDARHLEGTRAFLRTRDIPYIAVDVPQGHKTSMPPVFDVTSSKLAVVRFHGRNHETWELKGAPPNLRFRYDYSDQELSEWVPRIKEMEKSAKEVHALMNNNYSNYSVKNAKQLEKLLEAWQK